MSFLKENKIGILLSLAIGAIIAAPPIVFRFSSGYQGFPMMKTNTEAHYVAQVEEVYDGHYGLGNPFFADLKDSPYLFPPLSAHLVAWMGKIIGLSAIDAVMVLRFVFTSALAFFIYLFVSAISGKKAAGYVAAPFVLLGYSLVDPGYVLSLVRGGIPTHAGFIDYGRPINPQMSSLFFFAYLFFFWKSLHDAEHRVRSTVISAILLGLSFYAYLFTWSFIFALNASLALVYAIKKDWEKVRTIAHVSLGALIFAIPYMLNAVAASHHPAYAESAPRFGFVHMRTPNVSRLVVGAFLLFLATWRVWEARTARFFMGFFLAAFAIVNEQIITNLYVFNHHYHWYYNTPLVIVFFILLTFFGLSRVRQTAFRRACVVALVLVPLLHGILVQWTAYRTALPLLKEEQRYAPVIAWLNKETPKDATVVAPLPLSDVIPALTHNNIYFPNTGFYTLVSNERLLHTYLVYTYLRGVPKENIHSYFESRRDEISGYAFGYAYSFLPGVCYGCFPDSIIDSLAESYAGITDETFLLFMKQYPADYIVWDRRHDPDWALDRFDLTKLHAFGDITIYAL